MGIRSSFILLIFSITFSFTSQASSVLINLWGWRWVDIAKECTDYLGPNGFRGVQVMPPNEHRLMNKWYDIYQPVSYDLSRSKGGTRDEFIYMVNTCKQQGVDIIVDTVINHMGSEPTHGQSRDTSNGSYFNGSRYYQYYPVPYYADDFHNSTDPRCKADTPKDTFREYFCDLFGLPDLKTAKDGVRRKIAGYLNSLIELGVAGFRIDAATHIPASDLQGIFSYVQVPRGQKLLVLFELNYEEQDYLSPYLSIERTDIETRYIDFFHYSGAIGRAYRRHKNKPIFKQMEKIHESFRQREKGSFYERHSMPLIANHDTERRTEKIDGQDRPNTYLLRYQIRDLYKLAHIYMLALDWGLPQIFSGFKFNETSRDGREGDMPSEGPYDHTGQVKPDGQNAWQMFHRLPFIKSMLIFRHHVAGSMHGPLIKGNNDHQF